MRISRRIPLIWSCLMPLSNTLLVQQPCCKKRITSCATEGVVVIVTPKLNGPTSRLHGAEWNGFRHGYHTFLFTQKTLSQLMREAGFHVRRWPRRNRIFDDILILWGQKVADHKSLPN